MTKSRFCSRKPFLREKPALPAHRERLLSRLLSKHGTLRGEALPLPKPMAPWDSWSWCWAVFRHRRSQQVPPPSRMTERGREELRGNNNPVPVDFIPCSGALLCCKARSPVATRITRTQDAPTRLLCPEGSCPLQPWGSRTSLTVCTWFF